MYQYLDDACMIDSLQKKIIIDVTIQICLTICMLSLLIENVKIEPLLISSRISAELSKMNDHRAYTWTLSTIFEYPRLVL